MRTRRGAGTQSEEAGPDDHAAAVSAAGAVRRLTSTELFGGHSEVIIEHAGEDYRLRCTSRGKLILTK